MVKYTVRLKGEGNFAEYVTAGLTGFVFRCLLFLVPPESFPSTSSYGFVAHSTEALMAYGLAAAGYKYYIDRQLKK